MLASSRIDDPLHALVQGMRELEDAGSAPRPSPRHGPPSGPARFHQARPVLRRDGLPRILAARLRPLSRARFLHVGRARQVLRVEPLFRASRLALPRDGPPREGDHRVRIPVRVASLLLLGRSRRRRDRPRDDRQVRAGRGRRGSILVAVYVRRNGPAA